MMNFESSSSGQRNDDDNVTNQDREEEVGRRQARPIKPLGTSRRPARSKTPTQNNPNPKSNTGSRLRTGSQSAAIPTGVTASSSSSSAYEKRPWFPYPRNAKEAQAIASASIATTSASANRSTSRSDRRTSNSSTSSASSYDSGDLNSYRYRRAISAEPEEWSKAISRGRPIRGRVSDAIMTEEQERLPAQSEEREDESKSHLNSNTSSSEEDQDKERAHFEGVLRAFDSYLSYSLAANNSRRKSFYSLPRSHRLLFSSLGPTLPGPLLEREGSTAEEHSVIVGGRGFKARLDEIDDRIRRNADFLSQIVSDSKGFLGEAEELSRSEVKAEDVTGAASQKTTIEAEQNESSGSGSSGKDRRGTSRSKSITSSSKEAGKQKQVSNHDVDKVRSTLKQFVRDWSEEGAPEREAAYDPILEALEKRFAHVPSAQRGQIRVLVPGAGLGRLAFEIAWQGFSCQGNEFSFFMLLASHFILNKTTSTNQHILYPFIHSSSNWRTAADMLRAIKIPDINPTDLPSHIDFSMVAGEFVEVYSKEQERGAWHSIATCFFIDTARNFARYLEVINHVLPIDGVWINIGPLLWHFEGATNGEISIELTLEEAIGLIELMGFVIEEQRTMKPQAYTGNPYSMLTYDYAPEFWIARKVRHVTPASAV